MSDTSKMKRAGMKKRTIDLIFVYAMLAIPIIHFCIFWIGVNFNSILMGFQTQNVLGETTWTVENFSYVLEKMFSSGSQIGLALKNTLLTWLYGNLFLFPVSILVSYFIYKKIRGGKFFRVIFYLPHIISSVALAEIFKYLIQDTGILGVIWLKYNPMVPDFLAEKEYAMKTVFIYMFFINFAGNMVLYSGAMNRIPKEMLESAEIDGVGMWRELVQFVIPCMWPTLSTIIILSITGLFTASGPILLLTKGAGDTTTISYWIFEQVKFIGSYNIPAALGLVFTAIGFPLVLVVRKVLGRLQEDVEY